MPKIKYNQSSNWQQRYKTTVCEHYEWLVQPDAFLKVIQPYLTQANRISQVLEIGCGTSRLALSFIKKTLQEVREASSKENIQQKEQLKLVVKCIDFSKQVVNRMRDQNIKMMSKLGLDDSMLKYELADIRDMKAFQNDKFDIILDKGCLDCLFCHDNFIKQVLKGLRQCYRILAPGGQFIIASHAKPKSRVYLLRNKLVPFRVRWEKIKSCYVYICHKEGKEGQEEQKEGEIIKQGQQNEDSQEYDKNRKQQDEEQKKASQEEDKIQEAQYQFDEE